MQHRLIVFLIAILTSAGLIAQPSATIHSLKPLEGVWKTTTGKKTIYESWKKVRDQELSGKSFALHGADTVVFEETRIAIQQNQLAYIAKVRQQNQGKEVVFLLKSSENQTYVFENLHHDFPQRVIYQFVGTDSLHAWIEGKDGETERRKDFYYKKQ